MRIKLALIFAFLITIVITNLYLLSSVNPDQSSRQKVLVGRVIDGDTLVLADNTKVRLVNINSPEKNVPSYILATDYLKQFENRTVSIENLGIDKYQRTLARVYAEDGRYINLELVENGLASKFLVQESELSIFSNGESRALESSKGIWNHSVHYGCLSSEIDKYKEMLIITNNCPQINFKDFAIKDESRKTYKFGELQFSRIILHSGSGQDNSTDLFWGQQDVWNNDRDTAYVFDNNNKIVYSSPYGY
jgi:endonuclease YncB( thermonuclease family)